MESELMSKIDEAGLPEELKAALRDLVQQAEPLLPALPPASRIRVNFMLNHLVTEATDPAADTHWWEVALDFLTKAAGGQGPSGQAVVAAVRQLGPLLRQQMGPAEEVTLREITAETVVGICLLSETLTEPKAHFVAPNAFSLAQAHFNPQAWFRAVYAGRAPVGFIMIVDNSEEQKYFLWRFMIAEPYHGRGYGRQAIERLVEYVRTRPGARELLVSCGEGEGSPEGFYRKLGFERTGEKAGEEVVLRMALAQPGKEE